MPPYHQRHGPGSKKPKRGSRFRPYGACSTFEAIPGSTCRSPFREDRSPSFSVFDDGRRWIDHATAERGDAVEFLAKIKGISNAEALVELLKMVDGTSHQPATTHYSATRTELRPGPDLHGIEPCLKPTYGKLQSFALSLLMVSGWRRSGSFCLPILTLTRDAVGSSPMTLGAALSTGGLMGSTSTIARPRRKERRPEVAQLERLEANWPIGIAQANGFPAIALCEGMPDFLSAFALAYAGAVEQFVTPVCMGGAACSIHPEALPMFRGKRVRIYGHADEAGQCAIQRWAEQLEGVQAEVDGFFFDGLLKRDGSPVNDMNDFLAADHRASGCGIE